MERGFWVDREGRGKGCDLEVCFDELYILFDQIVFCTAALRLHLVLEVGNEIRRKGHVSSFG